MHWLTSVLASKVSLLSVHVSFAAVKQKIIWVLPH